ncbi:MAG: RDD family protein [Chloroflexota bacterium]
MTNSIDTLQIDTPENVSFDYDVSGIGSRFLAALVDTLLILILQAVVLGTALLFIQLELSEELGVWVVAAFSLLAFVFFWGYYIFFEILWNGQTPGKRWVKLRVIRLDGTPVSVVEVVVRNLVRLVDFMPFAYAFGVATMFVTEKSRRLGDLAAGTVVVHERPDTNLLEGRAARQAALSTVTARVSLPDGFPVEKLTERDAQMIEDFILRRAQLPNRGELARHILSSLYARLGFSPTALPGYADADEILTAIYKTVRSRWEV